MPAQSLNPGLATTRTPVPAGVQPESLCVSSLFSDIWRVNKDSINSSQEEGKGRRRRTRQNPRIYMRQIVDSCFIYLAISGLSASLTFPRYPRCDFEHAQGGPRGRQGEGGGGGGGGGGNLPD